MLTHEKIADAIKKAANEFPLSKAEYFGSYADGCATDDSDVDILVWFDVPTISILSIVRLKRFLEEELSTSVDVIHAPIPEGSLIEIGRTVSVL